MTVDRLSRSRGTRTRGWNLPSNSFEPPTIKPPVYRRLLPPAPLLSHGQSHARIVVATKRHEEQVVVATIGALSPPFVSPRIRVEILKGSLRMTGR